VHESIDLGINFIDVSPFYGLTKSEIVLGKALKSVRRERYLLATKCGRYGYEMKDFDFSAKRITASIDESLGRMGVDYVDLLHAHDIEFGDLNQIIEETIPALRKIQKSGKARFIGVTGLPLPALREIAETASVDAILSYCRYSLNDTGLLELIPILNSRHVGVINASPLSMGLLSMRGAPGWHPAPAVVREVCARAAAHCHAKGASIERLAVQFAVANPEIASTFVSSANVENMRQNIAWADEQIDEKLLAEVLEILKPIHNVTWPSGRPENN
jgi:L-galactose dehydrogenase